jgi:hypothetical protein
MKSPLKPFTIIAFLLLTFHIFSQEKRPNDISLSLSYIPPIAVSSNWEFSLFPVFANVEANIHYKPFNFISFSSGLGYFVAQETYAAPPLPSSSEAYTVSKVRSSLFRIPLQVNYHIQSAPEKTDCYFKVVYTNGILVSKIRRYDNEEFLSGDRSYSYEPSVGIGIGSVFFKRKSVGMILEGTIEKLLRHDSYKDATLYSLKIGIVI